MLKTPFTTHKRARERGSHERKALYEILDATPICHIGHNVDGRPVVTPTCHWRDGDTLYWHGSRISRTIVESSDHDVCLTVTLLDGLVLARSAFHHSANYRSAMVFGRASLVEGDDEKVRVLKVFIERLFPGRWDALREVSRKELDATTVLSLPIEEASSKVRTGPPIDLEEDLSHPVWAGVVPLSTIVGEPVTAPDMTLDMPVPAHASKGGCFQ